MVVPSSNTVEPVTNVFSRHDPNDRVLHVWSLFTLYITSSQRHPNQSDQRPSVCCQNWSLSQATATSNLSFSSLGMKKSLKRMLFFDKIILFSWYENEQNLNWNWNWELKLFSFHDLWAIPTFMTSMITRARLEWISEEALELTYRRLLSAATFLW